MLWNDKSVATGLGVIQGHQFGVDVVGWGPSCLVQTFVFLAEFSPAELAVSFFGNCADCDAHGSCVVAQQTVAHSLHIVVCFAIAVAASFNLIVAVWSEEVTGN